MSYSALVLKSQSKFGIERFPKGMLGKRDGVLEVRAAGICGTDRHLIEGKAPLPYGTKGIVLEGAAGPNRYERDAGLLPGILPWTIGE